MLTQLCQELAAYNNMSNQYMEEFEQLQMEVAKGNREALDFINSFNVTCHAVDDIIDEKKSDAIFVLDTFMAFINTMNHSYYLKNKTSLLPILLLCLNDYADSNLPSEKFKDVLRFSGNYMLKVVAFIEGGYNHMRYVSPKLNALAYKTHHDEKTDKPI